ncbi:MAG TPA: pantoate--beta-alanine ligase [Actinomycetota bacterium]|nr:pantoate--beta-alanine ligase [Actinomycetota bacterium]
MRRREPLRDACDDARLEGRTVGFVPTMGFLHEGHLSLVRKAGREADLVVVSIFVNPLQFGPGEDLEAYPRDAERDLRLLEESKADLAFVPTVEEMLPDGGPLITVDPGPLGESLEGAARPGHFRGVCTVVAKLLGVVGPCRAYFGEKDAQQLAVVRRMVEDLDLPASIIAGETVREPDGLAMSSRNTYLSPEEREAARVLPRALTAAATLAEEGERDANVLRAEMAKHIGAEPLAELDYVAVVDEAYFTEVEKLDGAARALVAARVGPTRLIDNVRLEAR